MGKIVLVVEDDFYNRLLAVSLLESEGYEVVEAVDGNEALKALSSAMPDLVVLDINMPRVTGMEVLHQMRSCAEWQEVPVLAVTAYSSAQDRLVIQEAGANQLLSKPVSNHEFIATAANLIQNQALDL